MTLINLIKHPMTLVDTEGHTLLVLEGCSPESEVRVVAPQAQNVVGDVPVTVNGIEFFDTVEGADAGELINLPAQREGVLLLVSRAAGMHPVARARTDVRVPGTGPEDNPLRHPVKKFVVGIRKIKRIV